MTSEIEIEVKNMQVSYRKKRDVVALSNITVNIPRKQLTAIIGPSGCGKTTLLKALNRLHDIRDGVQVTGSIRIGGEDIHQPQHPVPELRRRVGLIAQKPYPLPASIYNNVAYGPRIHRHPTRKELDAIVERYLREAHLWDEVKDRLDDPAADLSMGQQQRLCIARTLAVEPEVILCDEVTSALDPVSSQKVEKLLLSLKERYTIILVTHVLRQAKRLADYIIFLYLGKLIEAGPAEQIFTQPRHKKTREYVQGSMAGI